MPGAPGLSRAQELDYELECANGIRVAEEMRSLPRVVIPTNFPEFTSRRVHTAEWVDGEKLSQSTADDVGELVNLGVITYLTQLLDTGFFHADVRVCVNRIPTLASAPPFSRSMSPSRGRLRAGKQGVLESHCGSPTPATCYARLMASSSFSTLG